MAVADENRSAILGALSILRASQVANAPANAPMGPQEGYKAGTASVLPTARVRAAIDLLARSDASKVLDGTVDMRAVSNDLFNWKNNKASKLVVKALAGVLADQSTYPQGVEIAAYVAAWAPILEPDRIARIILSAKDIKLAYAPAPYTVQLHAKIAKLFLRYPEERREKLAISLWQASHSGRWWDIAAGDDNDQRAAQALVQPKDLSELVEDFTALKIFLTDVDLVTFSKVKESKELREAVAEYRDRMYHEEAVDPDFAVYAAALPWLRPADRPESPVGSLLGTLIFIAEEVIEDFTFPAKPKSFKEMFPNIRFYGRTLGFPFPPSIMATDRMQLTPDTTLEVVSNQADLAENRTYMGNCTYSYKGQMEDGSYVLYRIHDQAGNIYNGSIRMNSNNKTWHVSEINSRFNAGNVPQNIRQAFSAMANALPPNEIADRLTYEKEIRKAMADEGTMKRQYTYRLD